MKQQILIAVEYINSLSTPEQLALFACQLAVIALGINIISAAVDKMHESIQTTVTNAVAHCLATLTHLAWSATIPVIIMAVVMHKMGWVL